MTIEIQGSAVMPEREAVLGVRENAILAMPPARNSVSNGGEICHTTHVRKRQSIGAYLDNSSGLAAEIMQEIAITPMPTAGSDASEMTLGEARYIMREGVEAVMPPPAPSRKGHRKAKAMVPEQAKVLLPSDELIQTIRDISKTRATWQMARAKLHLHALALCRSACNGDKTEAVKLFKATASGDDIRLLGLIGPFIEDIERWTARIAPLEKHLVSLLPQTPIGDYVKATKGLGALSIATMIGHTGALNNYATVYRLWSRLGLGVNSDGDGRQMLLVPGIADLRPRRASAFVIGAGLIKAGNADFRAIYDREKAKALAKEWPKARAHNHAMRVGTKWAVKQMWKAWRNDPP